MVVFYTQMQSICNVRVYSEEASDLHESPGFGASEASVQALAAEIPSRVCLNILDFGHQHSSPHYPVDVASFLLT